MVDAEANILAYSIQIPLSFPRGVSCCTPNCLRKYKFHDQFLCIFGASLDYIKLVLSYGESDISGL